MAPVLLVVKLTRKLLQAFNDADETRVILLVNFYHPDLDTADWKPLRV